MLDEAPAPVAPDSEPVPDLVGNAKELPLGPRLAGVVLLLNALTALVELVIAPAAQGAGPDAFRSPFHIILDAAIGAALLRGIVKWRKIALFKVALGAVFFTVMALSRSDWFQAAGQLMLSGALIGLLTGTPGRPRIAVSLTAVGLLFCLEGVGLYALVTGSNPMARIALRARGEIEADPIREVKGERSPWRLRAPDGKWHLRTSEAAARDNPLVDKWLIAPVHDAHVIVIPELAEGIDADALAKVVLDNARDASSAFRVVDEPKPLTSAIGPARLSHSASTINGIRLESYYAVFVGKTAIYQVIAFAPAESFAGVSAELLEIIHSFAL